ncbi:MAG: hypothetical protein Q7J34_11785 [Bacteroidales bacterium]|jgi:ABC-type transport system involved in multi-copper enzyme maturation permease subunit|nr:hypothetical protein [Bacteroidales bacterium]
MDNINPTSEFASFWKRLTFYTLALAVVAVALSFILPSRFTTPSLPFIILFFYALTLIVHKIGIRIAAHKITKFTQFYMISTASRLVIFLAILLIYSFNNPADAVAFIITFFISYVLFLIFELTAIVRFLKKHQNGR